MTNRRPAIMAVVSVAIGIALICFLFERSGISLADLARRLVSVKPGPAIAVVLLIAFNAFLASEKWRLVDPHFGGPRAEAMPRRMYFALTAIGVGLGQLLPVPLSLALSRAVGARAFGGRALVRGAGGTAFEQFFDLAIAASFGIGTVLLVAGTVGRSGWFVSAAIALAVGFSLGGFVPAFAGRLARLAARAMPAGRLSDFLRRAAASPLFGGPLFRRLLALSLLRFAILVLLGKATAAAISLQLPAWQIAAAMPLASLANALSITPGGLGFNEWAVSGILFCLGVPFHVSSQWTIINRILVGLATTVCGGVGALMALLAGNRRLGVGSSQNMRERGSGTWISM